MELAEPHRSHVQILTEPKALARLISGIVLFTVGALLPPALSQEWYPVNPTFDVPGSYDMSRAFFVDNGWFAEVFPARIWHTSDGGVTWRLQKDSSDAWIYDIAFIDALVGWATGETVSSRTPFWLKTTNGGSSWEQVGPLKTYRWLFLNSLVGFAYGDTTYRTTDGGHSWLLSSPQPDLLAGLRGMFFIDNLNGWAVGGSSYVFDAGIIVKTTDGGQTWSVNEHPSGITGQDVYFVDTLHGCIVGSNPPYFEGVVWTTSDGGESWHHSYLPCSWLQDVAFSDDSTGWAVGNGGFLWRTQDRGVTWQAIQTGTNADLGTIVFLDNASVGYVLGANNTFLTYTRTTDLDDHLRVQIPSDARLFQNYPNPFNSSTTISYAIPAFGDVQIFIYNNLGQEVFSERVSSLSPGFHTLRWSPTAAPSGVYFCYFHFEEYVAVKKMLLLK